MEEGADDLDVDILDHIRFWVATILVSYSCGPRESANVKPYGLKASRSTHAFKMLPSQHLAITFATLYQCVRTEPHNIDNWVKSTRPNITGPWPRGMVQRFVKLQSVFVRERANIFKAYEAANGEYHGDEPGQEPSKKKKRVQSKTVMEFDEDF